MTGLSRRFQPVETYRKAEQQGYSLLPIRFTPLDEGRIVVTNMVGEFIVLTRGELVSLVDGVVTPSTPLYDDLKSRHFIYDQDSNSALDLLGLKYRSKLHRLAEFTALHIFVVSLRCDYSCQYCQVSRQTEDRAAFDMSPETADAALAMVFLSPATNLKIEFQGGEPLLNFDLIRYIVAKAKVLNTPNPRNLQFVITTNLSYLNDEVMQFCRVEGVYLSTSLDGPAWLHNKNRPRPGKNGHELTVDAIRRIQSELGRDHVSALMTTTLESLEHVGAIIDEYVALDLHSIFLRPLSPYGFAVKSGHINKYDTERWIDFYKQGLDYILRLNRSGYRLTEQYTTIILRKMLTAQDPGYVDLQSPAGAGLSAIVYNYDGDIYASDEARMLAEMGDKTFRMGNVHIDKYEDIYLNDTWLDALEQSITVSAPTCTDCAFLPYCGSDPVGHYATQHDWVGNKAISAFCSKNMAIFKHLTTLLEDDPQARKTLLGWL